MPSRSTKAILFTPFVRVSERTTGVAVDVLGSVGVAVGEAVGVAGSAGLGAGVGEGVGAVGSSLTAGPAVAAGIDVITSSGVAACSSPPPQLVAISAPTINSKSMNVLVCM